MNYGDAETVLPTTYRYTYIFKSWLYTFKNKYSFINSQCVVTQINTLLRNYYCCCCLQNKRSSNSKQMT